MQENLKIKKFYQKKYAKYGFSSRSLSWKHIGAMHQRFRQFWAEIDFSGKSILDVGCGFASFARFLGLRYHNFTYTGIDIVPEFVAKSKKRYPQHKFVVGDYFQNPIKKNYEVIIASGVLNSNVCKNYDYRKGAIKVMFDHTKGVLAFNMLGAHPAPKNKKDTNIWNADSIEILKFCLTLTKRVILRQNYNSRDFTLFLFKSRRK